MGEPRSPELTRLGQALGRVPSGLYILTVRHDGKSTGMLASWVQQAGFDPPMVTVAVNADRFVGDWIERSGRFALNQIATGSKALIRHFGRGFAADAPAFEGLAPPDEEMARGGPILEGAMAFLDAEVVGRLAGGDHHVFLARIVAGGVLHPEAEPLVHVRANGFHY